MGGGAKVAVAPPPMTKSFLCNVSIFPLSPIAGCRHVRNMSCGICSIFYTSYCLALSFAFQPRFLFIISTINLKSKASFLCQTCGCILWPEEQQSRSMVLEHRHSADSAIWQTVQWLLSFASINYRKMEAIRRVFGQLPGSFSKLPAEGFCHLVKYLSGKSYFNI